MRYLLIIITILIGSCRQRGNDTGSRNLKSVKDSLNGNYEEVIRVKGIPTSVKYYENYRLVAKGFYQNGYLIDLIRIDSLENIIEHLPIVVWTNPNNIKNLDTLRFTIRNVDSLTYYQYFYETNFTKFTQEEHQIAKQKPTHFNTNPFIKIPTSEVIGADMIYFKCGVLIGVVDDSDSVETHKWKYFWNKFELK